MTEILEAPQPRSVRKELDKVAVGRVLLGALRGQGDYLDDMLDAHEASYDTERAGLLYIPPITIARYAGKTIMGRHHLQDAIDRLGPSIQKKIDIIRGDIQLFPTNPDSTKADYYKVTAPMRGAFDATGVSKIPDYERSTLEREFAIPRSRQASPILFGVIKLPVHSPDQPALQEMFNDLYPSHLHVGPVQILDKR